MASQNRSYNESQDYTCESDTTCDECWQAVQSKEGIESIQHIMQNQNQFLKSMLLQLLDELKRSSTDKDNTPCIEAERSMEAMRKELKKLRKENGKIKETLYEKQANLAKCLAVLESNNSDIDKLSKHIECLCAERDQYKNQISQMQSILLKKDATISKLTANTAEKMEQHFQKVSNLKEQLDRYKAQYCKQEEEIKELRTEVCKYKALYEELYENNKKQENMDCSKCPEEPSELCSLIHRLKFLEKELEASNVELSEYEEENRFYTQKIEGLMKTVKCLQEAKLRSEEDSSEYCKRLNNMRAEFQETCDNKSKLINDLKTQLKQSDDNKEKIMKILQQRDEQIQKLSNQLKEFVKDKNQCEIMEEKYKELQHQFESYSKKINMLQQVLKETYSKLDICDKTIKDLENKNRLLEEKIKSLEFCLNDRVNGTDNCEIKVKELECFNLKLQKEIRNKEYIIKNLEECLDRSNQILTNCEKEMCQVEKRNTQFKKEMYYIKSKLEGELFQNQCLAIKCNLLNESNGNVSEGDNIDEDVTKLKCQYKNLLAEATEKENRIEYIKAELIRCFDKEETVLSNLRTPSCTPLCGGLCHSCKPEVMSKSKCMNKTHKCYDRIRSRSPHISYHVSRRSKSCPEKKCNIYLLHRISSTPNLARSRIKATKPEEQQERHCTCSDEEQNELVKLPKSVRSLIQYHKKRKTKPRNAWSDTNLKKITIQIFNPKWPKTNSSWCPHRTCQCMRVIMKKYNKDKGEKQEKV